MLVLSRQRDETIMIGDDIEITVVDIRGDKVRLGIAAPSKIAVHRKEVYESIRRENEQAARISDEQMSPLTIGAAAPTAPRARAITQDSAARASAVAKLLGAQGPSPSKVPRSQPPSVAAKPMARSFRKAV